MRIMFCLGSMTKGGAERVIANLSNEFCQEHSISIIVTPPDEPMYKLDNKINFITLDKCNDKKENIIVRTVKRIKRLRKIIKNINPDIIVSLLPEPTYRVMIAKIGLSKKTIISVRNDPKVEYKKFLNKIIMKILYPFADGFIFQTQEAKEYFGINIQKKSVIIPNPINEEFVCEKYKGEREKIVVTVGRLEEQKNQKMLINAFSRLPSEFAEYKLIIYGDGTLRKELEKQIKDLNLTERVKLPGEVDDIKNKIYKASLFVLSSDYEGMPNSLMEALTLGVPCISTDCPCGGPRFLIENNVSGFLIKQGNEEEMLNAIQKVLNSNKNEINEITDKAQERMFNIKPSKINKKWIEFMKYVKELK